MDGTVSALLVEPDPERSGTLRTGLERSGGVDVRQVTDVEGARAALRERHVDWLLCRYDLDSTACEDPVDRLDVPPTAATVTYAWRVEGGLPAGAIDAGVTAVLDPSGDEDQFRVLANRLAAASGRSAGDGGDDGDVAAELRESRHKIKQLHEIASEMEGCRSEQAVYDLTVEAAERILDFDLCVVDKVEDGELVPMAISSEMPTEGYETVPVEEGGLAGRTVEEGVSFLVDDLRENPAAEPAKDSYRSAISVPIGDIGVFQAAASDVAAYVTEAVELTELLASHAHESLERIESERELAERERFLSTLIDNLPGLVYRCRNEDDWPMEFVSDGCRRLTGYDREALLAGEVAWDADVVHPDDLEQLRTAIQEALENEESFKEVYRIVTEDGTQRWVWEQGQGVPGDDGELWYIEGFIVDITERKESQAELKRQKERLDEFAEIVSHDLRGPLSIAEGHLSLVREEHEGESVEMVGQALSRMDRIIEDVLTLTRQGELIDEVSLVSVEAVVREAWTTVGTREMTLEVADPGTVSADRTRLQQLLENLFRNAAEHARSDATIRVGSLDGGGFYVADDGPGIPPAEREEIMDLGVTTGNGNTGIGLGVVSRIADGHGWDVAVAESEAGGARFEFAE